jgi:hypothetical protein
MPANNRFCGSDHKGAGKSLSKLPFGVFAALPDGLFPGSDSCRKNWKPATSTEEWRVKDGSTWRLGKV